MKRKITCAKISVDENYIPKVARAWIWRGENPKGYPIYSSARFIRVSQLMRALLRKIRVS